MSDRTEIKITVPANLADEVAEFYALCDYAETDEGTVTATFLECSGGVHLEVEAELYDHNIPYDKAVAANVGIEAATFFCRPEHGHGVLIQHSDAAAKLIELASLLRRENYAEVLVRLQAYMQETGLADIEPLADL